jgi:membrane protease YdiL (CAAX protease family)
MNGSSSSVPPGAERRNSVWQRRIAALMEIIGVFVGGTLLARLVGAWLGLERASIRTVDPDVAPDFLKLSWTVGVNLLLRYAVVLGLAFLVGWWHRRRSPAAYGVTTVGSPLRVHMRTGLLLFAVGGFLPRLLFFLKSYVPLGAGPQRWALLEDSSAPWFWLYMAVSSYGLVPILEELLARGYIQSRLTEDFGPLAAILMTALFFALSHRQYFIATPLGLGMLAAILFSAIIVGYVRHRTGSLLPGMIGHALGNVPVRGLAQMVVLALMVLAAGFWRRDLVRYAREIWRDLAVPEAMSAIVPGLVVLGLVLSLVILAPQLLAVTSTAALMIALLLELREKRSNFATRG